MTQRMEKDAVHLFAMWRPSHPVKDTAMQQMHVPVPVSSFHEARAPDTCIRRRCVQEVVRKTYEEDGDVAFCLAAASARRRGGVAIFTRRRCGRLSGRPRRSGPTSPCPEAT